MEEDIFAKPNTFGVKIIGTSYEGEKLLTALALSGYVIPPKITSNSKSHGGYLINLNNNSKIAFHPPSFFAGTEGIKTELEFNYQYGGEMANKAERENAINALEFLLEEFPDAKCREPFLKDKLSTIYSGKDYIQMLRETYK